MLRVMLIILFFTGLMAGTIDAIAGGGGLISLPVLLSLGVPPHIALGTNKLQSTVGTMVATYSYYKARLFNMKMVYQGLAFGVVGTVLGSVASQLMSSAFLKQLIPVLLILIFFYTILSPRLGLEDRKPRLSEHYFYMIFGAGLGFYDGFFGPATGSFWVFSLIFFLGYNLTKAAAYTKVFNLKSNIIALACFAIGGNIDYRIGLCMAVGQLLGGRLGAYLAIRNGARMIRPIFMVVVTISILSLIYQNHFSGLGMSAVLAMVSWPIVCLGFILVLGLSMFAIWANLRRV